jgi:hypothetical protein
MVAKLLLLALCASAIACVSAVSISFDLPGAPVTSTPPFSDQWTFPTFNQALGTLTQVTVTGTATPTITAQVQNPDASARHFDDVQATITFTVRFFAPGVNAAVPANAFSTTSGSSTFISNVPGDLTLDQETATRTGDGSQVNAVKVLTAADGATFTAFLGSTGVDLTLTGNAGNALIGGDGTPGLQYSGTATMKYDITLTYVYTAVVGDPQFSGFQSQSYQVHGVPDSYFNLISTPEFYLNSRFVYLANGVCDYDDTPCWTHPGTYIDRLAFVSNDYRVEVVAGTHQQGLKVSVNGKHVAVNGRVSMPSISNTSSVHVSSHSHATVSMGEFSMDITNSDLFFNIGTALNDAETLRAGAKVLTIPQGKTAAEADKLISRTYPERQIHGLLGQTWRNIQWPNGKSIQGDVSDYETENLWSSDFVYTQFIAPKKSS